MSDVRIHVLRLHAGYQCAHAGVCCTEDWAIPVEARLHRQLLEALATSALQPEHRAATYFAPASPPSDLEPVVVGRVGCDCAFFEPAHGRLCSIHRQLGHGRLPSACQHFPRVVTIDPRGIFVSLSYVCPTAGRLLRTSMPAPFDLVHEGPVATPGLQWAGLDARESLPPQVSGRVLWDWEALTVWERGILDLLGRREPEHALAALADAALQIERWRPSQRDTLAAATATALRIADWEAELRDRRIDVDRIDAIARQATPHASLPPPSGRRAIDAEKVEPAWSDLAPLVNRYLASRTMANAVGYHAGSARVWAATLDTAYSVLRVEAARQASDADRLLDVELLVAAAAAADRLLVHRVDPARLAALLLGAVP